MLPDEYLVCRNGKQYDKQYQCVYEYSKYNRLYGCQDFSHLTDCSKFGSTYTFCRKLVIILHPTRV